jgi:predicted metal-dependent HD superfamily phosphohydrolase
MDARLADLARRLSFDCPGILLERVARRYAEAHRRYHTLDHVIACLDARAAITRAALPEVDLALVFHDAVYDPLGTDNEARSALLLVEEGRRAWLHDGLVRRAQPLVAATRHGEDAALDSEEACIVVDADLSILGSPLQAFTTYERLVREEYACFDDAAYAVGRAAVLESFLARPTLFATRRAQHLWEAQARSNLERSLAALRASLRSC